MENIHIEKGRNCTTCFYYRKYSQKQPKHCEKNKHKFDGKIRKEAQYLCRLHTTDIEIMDTYDKTGVQNKEVLAILGQCAADTHLKNF